MSPWSAPQGSASRSSWGLVEPPFPWVYDYQEDGPRLGGVVLRPVVPVSIVGPLGVSPVAWSLVDSGCSHVLAAPWLAPAIGVDPDASGLSIKLGMGGDNHTVRFTEVTMRLYAPGGDDEAYVEWTELVGFFDRWRATWPVLVGQDAFMKQFTVTMSRFAQALAVENAATFDNRFPPDARGH